MLTTLPVPIRFDLPEGWGACDPHVASTTGVAFAGRRGEADPRFTPTITIDGDAVDAGVDLDRLGDESIDRLSTVFDAVALIDRRHTGTAEMPFLVQSLAVEALIGDAVENLIQDQVYALFTDGRSMSAALVRTVLTSHRDQHLEAAAEFRTFLQTIELDRD